MERELSAAKLNLFLKVTKRRADGFHELETLFLPVSSPADRITVDFDGEPGIRVRSSQPGLPENLNNIAGRAALAYAEAAGIAPAFDIFIDKQIPVAAGMGGGSANAGTVLRLCDARYKAIPAEELSALALTLGADVPFFLNPRLARATGVGEIFEYPQGEFRIPPLLIVNPCFPVSAKWAYQHLSAEHIGEDKENRSGKIIDALRRGDAETFAENLHNDLAFALYEKFPLLRQLKEFMCRNGALNAEVTGSGSTLFAVCRNTEELHRVRQTLRENFSPASLRIWPQE
ncbi:MAG: 4-(cytidine 5'-diphospho)-2-C-methyl-D-erythritol kinase [Lentisphaeria bacterium]|nr:4-(cytidine 5'-diphospho)-2-C-methyl-D-erythritol kinase [Lentisphaeria bacterium]